MPDAIVKIVQQMQESPGNISFSNLGKVCDHYFGKPRQDSSSHKIYKTPWPGDTRINIQNDKGKVKAYQVRQVLRAISKLEARDGNKTDETG